jgi:hypothetical protein
MTRTLPKSASSSSGNHSAPTPLVSSVDIEHAGAEHDEQVTLPGRGDVASVYGRGRAREFDANKPCS